MEVHWHPNIPFRIEIHGYNIFLAHDGFPWDERYFTYFKTIQINSSRKVNRIIPFGTHGRSAMGPGTSMTFSSTELGGQLDGWISMVFMLIWLVGFHQPIWKNILVEMGSSSPNRDEKKTCWKPPSSDVSWFPIRKKDHQKHKCKMMMGIIWSSAIRFGWKIYRISNSEGKHEQYLKPQTKKNRCTKLDFPERSCHYRTSTKNKQIWLDLLHLQNVLEAEYICPVREFLSFVSPIPNHVISPVPSKDSKSCRQKISTR